MDEHDKRRIGEEIEPGGRPKAPGRLALLQRFVNTHNHDFPPEWDRLGSGEQAEQWLKRAGLIAADDAVSEADAARLRELRETLRAVIVRPNADAAAIERVRAAAAAAPLRMAIDDTGRTALESARGGVDGAVATLLGILHEAQLSGDWPRLKGCRQCGYAFYDRSKNRSAAWCDMSICGNRTKNRAYYRRRRDAAP
jgi:predicted RNA-binding Zn ribbon-like protein